MHVAVCACRLRFCFFWHFLGSAILHTLNANVLVANLSALLHTLNANVLNAIGLDAYVLNANLLKPNILDANLNILLHTLNPNILL